MENKIINIGHIRKDQDDIYQNQTLEDHLDGTAELAEQFCSEIGCKQWGKQLGFWHDIGKYTSTFQKYIRVNSGYIDEEQKLGKTDHSSAGAIYAKMKYPSLWQPLAYIIAGHHSGLLNWDNEIGISGDLQSRLQKEIPSEVTSQLSLKYTEKNGLPIPFNGKLSKENAHLWIRMMFSCLVDADYLDTEKFMNQYSFDKRGKYSSMQELKNVFDLYMEKISKNATPSFINKIRTEIYSSCIHSADSGSGFFDLNVPTGGGKTLSSMGFALTHAIKNNKKRIIIVIPYTSIIVQTAKIFKEIFGDDNVIEHHSNLDDDACTEKQKLAIENWDAPIIVTTNVQLFESLYANKTSRCRKLHNITNSILILDEAQMLPIEFLKPVLSALNELHSIFNVTVLFTTATLPVLSGRIGESSSAFNGINFPVSSIIENVDKLETSLRRVNIEMPSKDDKMSFEDIAFELEQNRQVLCIVNTRNECSEIYRCMPEGTIHLSRMMCSSHIIKTIETIKKRLVENENVRVISTQLIEAGVDIDFPVVYRAFAGLDSIAQAAGRCNREGKLNKKGELGKVKVFHLEKEISRGFIAKGADALTEIIYSGKTKNYLSSSIFKTYFNLFYSKVATFDKAQIKSNLIDSALEMKFQFATAARNFKLIDDDGKSFIVWYGDGKSLIELLKKKGPEPWLMRKLQSYSVSVREKDFIQLAKEGRIDKYHEVWVQTDPFLYSDEIGLVKENHWLDETYIV